MLIPWILIGIYLFTALLSIIAGLFTRKTTYFLSSGLAVFLAIIQFQNQIISSNIFIFLLQLILLTVIIVKSLSDLKDLYTHKENGNIENTNESNKYHKDTIVLKSKAVIIVDQILYIKSEGPYTEFFLINKSNPEVDRNSLSNVLKILSENSFSQIHKTIIVNRKHITKIEKESIYLGVDIVLPYSKSYHFEI